MATFSQSSMVRASDSFTDFCCSRCLDYNNYQLPEFYCNNCLKFYCEQCIKRHGQLFGKHVTYGKGDTSKWPVSKEVEDFLQKCDLHEEQRLEKFCNDHSQLCCTHCALRDHRKCAKVTLESKSVKRPLPDLQQLSRKIQTILEELKELQNNWDTNMQSLQISYNKNLHEIRETRQKINTIFDEIEKTTIKELDDKMTSLKAFLPTNLDNCIKLKSELKQLRDAIHHIVDKGKAELSFIASKKCLEKIQQSETFLKENSVQGESSLTFKADDDVQQYLSTLSGLGKIVLSTRAFVGDQDQVFAVYPYGNSEYDVSIRSDSAKSSLITAICVLFDDEILVADCENDRVKLLNHQYQVVGYCDLTMPVDMCQISPNEVAVAMLGYKTSEVQFVSVNGGRLVKGRKIQFQHKFFVFSGIAHNLQDLYLTSGFALYKYSMSGDMLNKLYEDTSRDNSVSKCAVSPSGDKIFVINMAKYMVLTLARDGTVLHTFTDRDLSNPHGIHVTALGQVLVCGNTHANILQLDGEGKKKLATFSTRNHYDSLYVPGTYHNGPNSPWSVCYNRSTASIIVGLAKSNKIIVFKVK